MRRPIHDLLNRLAAAEERFLAAEFLAPLPRGGVVGVRVAGVVCRLRVADDFTGWGVFRPTSATTARLVRPASLSERRRYLELLPARRLVLCQPRGVHWLAQPMHGAAELLSVHLVEDGQRFDVVEARCDGVQHWFERSDGRADPAAAAYLREAFLLRTPPDQIRRPGLGGAQRATYAIAHELRAHAERDRTEERLRAALAHAGGDLRGYLARDDGLRVEYEVDGERHVSLVRKDDLSVQLAGVCLNGEDARFDLHSLVGVLREAHGEDVLRIGEDNRGMDEQRYWQVHPAR
jgi:hypothetical protein